MDPRAALRDTSRIRNKKPAIRSVSLALLICWGIGVPASRQALAEGREQARALLDDTLDEAAELADERRFGEAIKLYLQVESELLPHADLPDKRAAALTVELYSSLARGYDQLGDVMQAKRYYSKFLGVAPPKARGMRKRIQQAREAQERLDNLLARTSIQFEIDPPGTEIRVDRRMVGAAPVDPVRVTPGPHQVTLWAEGYQPASLMIEVAAGGSAPVVFRLVPDESGAPAPQASDEPSASRMWWVIGGATLAVAATVASVLLLYEPEEEVTGAKVDTIRYGRSP